MGERLTTDYRAKVYEDSTGTYVEIGDDCDGLDLCDITYRETVGRARHLSIVIGWPHAEAVARAILKLCEVRAAFGPEQKEDE